MRGAAERLASLRRERARRSEEHTSELQSQSNIVCRLLLEKKNGMPISSRATAHYNHNFGVGVFLNVAHGSGQRIARGLIEFRGVHDLRIVRLALNNIRLPY